MVVYNKKILNKRKQACKIQKLFKDDKTAFALLFKIQILS
jgi:hypothetical protein